MRIKFYRKINNQKIRQGIYDLLVACDNEFIPPLSARNSTTQTNLTDSSTSSAGITDYFNNVMRQNTLVVIEKKEVVAFMSFRENYVCENISRDNCPNVYVSTVIVHPAFRHQGIANKLYDRLLAIYPRHYIFTRTWSTNNGHTRILRAIGFSEHCYLHNDRGEGIDTVYYRYKSKKLSLREYITQYRLSGNILFSVLLTVFSIGFIFAWLYLKEGIAQELMLAIATSLMASLLCLLSDTFLKIRESRNDEFISKLKDFGIENLHFNKSETLEKLIPSCRNEIWISGYRLIMTSKPTFRNALVMACKRSHNLNVKLLVVPPWTVTYDKTYGQEDTTANYLVVLRDLCECVEKYNLNLEVRFADHPLFSDTYNDDDRFITGPYLNCIDRYKNRITAKDFFSLDVVGTNKDLYNIIYNDYMTVWCEAYAELNVQALTERLKSIPDVRALTKQERIQILKDCEFNIDEK